jgi:hypothetical protein
MEVTMKRFLNPVGWKLALLAVLCLAGTNASAQGTATTLSGTVVDTSKAAVPGAVVVAKNSATGAETHATTDAEGRFVIPALEPGRYKVTITLAGFKTAVLPDVKVIASTPLSVRATLEVGRLEETVTVEGAAQILQTETATVTTTLTTQQLTNIPLPSRNTMDFIAMLPGVATPGTIRDSTVMGLRDNATNITIDGVNVQDNYLKSSDGFFARINPRLDAVEEVTVSTAGAGADAAGQGAVQIQFVTRQGTNKLQGSAYWYRRRPNWNSPYWFNERDGLVDTTEVDTYGVRLGGPIVIPKIFDGHNKAFFFFNMEEFKLPGSTSRNRTIMTTQAQQGLFRYNAASGVQTVNLLTLAAANGQTATADPTIAKLLADIRASTGTTGTISDLTDPNLQRYAFANQSEQVRRYPTVRLDFNVSKNHRVGFSTYYQQYRSNPDTLNSVDPAFPGFPNQGGQNSDRYSVMGNWRGVFKTNLVNELRVASTGGPVDFFKEITPAQFGGTSVADQGGYGLNITNFAAISNAWVSRAPSNRDAPTSSIDDTVNWIKGAHNIRIGGTLTQIDMNLFSGNILPSINFGVDSADPANAVFNTANFPGASATDLTNARNLYAVLTGRVTAINGTAYLDGATGQYVYHGRANSRGRMRELGIFLQDQWRVKPNLTLNAGVRWEVQFPFTALNDYYSQATTPDGLYGVSGPGNIFKPGTLTGSPTRYVAYTKGTKAYNTDWNNLAPNVGLVWTPKAQDGFLGKLMGGEGDFVIRGGYTLSYNREGMSALESLFGANPGGNTDATRSTTLGNIGQPLPLLFRSGNLGPGSYPAAPAYPLAPIVTNSVNVFDPNTSMPYTHSFSVGIQRLIGKATALELRYVGTRGRNGWVVGGRNYNEVNLRENGFLNEFKVAQANLKANIAAGRGNTFAYTGAPGTSPLPTLLAYFSGIPGSRAGDASLYTSTNFANSTYVGYLAAFNPAPMTFANALGGTTASTATFRNNALAAGLPSNFFVVNPDVLGGAWLTTNDQLSSNYDALQIEVRRRFAGDLLIAGNYSLANATMSNFYTLREPAELITSNASSSGGAGVGSTLRHAFKMNWVWELPFGKGKKFGGSAGSTLDRIIGGWQWSGNGRIQSGQIFDFGGLTVNNQTGNVRLVGMSPKEFQKMFKVYQRPDSTGKIRIYMLPQDVIDNTIKAFNASATSPTGYGALGAPSGQYLAPASNGDCIEWLPGGGSCAPRHIFATGPTFYRFDMSLAKRIPLVNRVTAELRLDAMNVFDNINFLPTTTAGAYAGATQANYEVTRAYQDLSGTQDPGGRILQLSARISW